MKPKTIFLIAIIVLINVAAFLPALALPAMIAVGLSLQNLLYGSIWPLSREEAAHKLWFLEMFQFAFLGIGTATAAIERFFKLGSHLGIVILCFVAASTVIHAIAHSAMEREAKSRAARGRR